MKLLSVLFLIITAASLLLNIILLSDRYTFKKITFKVVEVIDGDTFKIKMDKEVRRVRLMGVDTPQMGKCLSLEAKEKLVNLVLAKEVRVEDQFSDPYGRIMANVFVGNEFINKEMLASGMGRMDYYENPRREDMKGAYLEARTNKRGVFSRVCLSTEPPTSRESGIPCAIKGNLDSNTQRKVYFLPECRNYTQVTIDLSTDDQWFCSEGEATAAGFVRSSSCL